MAEPTATDVTKFLQEQAQKRLEREWAAVESEFSDLQLYKKGGRMTSPDRLQLFEQALANLKRTLTQVDTYREILNEKK